MKKILFRYLLFEQIPVLVIGLLLFSFVLISNQMFRSVDMATGATLPLDLIIRFLVSLVPYLLMLTIPMACLMAVLLTYGKLSEQNEIQAMLSAGVSYGRIIAPAVVLGFGISAAMFFWCDTTIPRAHRLRVQLIDRFVESFSAIGLREGTFITRLDNRHVFYAKQFDPETSTLKGILLYQMTGNSVDRLIMSPEGSVRLNPERLTLELNLEPGSINEPVEDGGMIISRFGQMNIQADISSQIDRVLSGETASHLGATRAELRSWLKRGEKFFQPDATGSTGPLNNNPPPGVDQKEWAQWMNKNTKGQPSAEKARERWLEVAVEYHRRLALPMACGFVAIVAAPLGVIMGRGKRAVLFVVSLGLITAYYFLLAGGIDLVHEGKLPPGVGVWMANGMMLAAGLFLNQWASKQH